MVSAEQKVKLIPQSRGTLLFSSRGPSRRVQASKQAAASRKDLPRSVGNLTHCLFIIILPISAHRRGSARLGSVRLGAAVISDQTNYCSNSSAPYVFELWTRSQLFHSIDRFYCLTNHDFTNHDPRSTPPL